MLSHVFVIAQVLFFCAHITHGFLVRDVDGNWREFGSVKRNNEAGPGALLLLGLTNHNDKSYSLRVRMGTPLQDVRMAISLSQNFMVVASPSTSGDVGFYNPSASATYEPTNISANIFGSSGSTNTATFAGESCQISDFNYNASIAVTPASANANSDLYPEDTGGILGCGVNTPASVPADSAFLASYIPKGLKSATAICGIELNRAGDPDGGLFTMGGVDQTAYSGNFTKLLVPSTASLSWSVPLDAMFVSLDSGVAIVAGGLSSVDPYYSKIGLPANVVKSVYSRVSGAAPFPSNSNRYTVPCDTNFSITLVFDGKNFTMDPLDSISVENNSISVEGDLCFGTVEIAASGNVYQIGSPFLRNVYTAFGADYDASGNAALFVAFADKVIRGGTRH